MSDRINRSIYYYEMFAYSLDKDSNTAKKEYSFINKFFSLLASEQYGKNTYTDFAVKTPQGELFLVVDDVQNNNYKFRMVLCRENALPYIETNGRLEELGQLLDSNQNIAEVTHCIYYGDYGVLGAEFNYNGARCSLLPHYIMAKSEEHTAIMCTPKLNKDIYSLLTDGKDYTLFEFAVATNSQAYTNVLAKKSIFSALQCSAPESDIIEVKIKKRRTKSSSSGFELPLTKEEINDLLVNYREDLKVFKLSQNALSDTVDMLSEKFVGKTTLIKTDSRSINSESMYDAINSHFVLNVESYCEIKDVKAS